MPLIHKSVCVREEVWRRLRINSELSGVAVRDYLTYVILTSQPVVTGDPEAKQQMEAVVRENQRIRQETGMSSDSSPAQVRSAAR